MRDVVCRSHKQMSHVSPAVVGYLSSSERADSPVVRERRNYAMECVLGRGECTPEKRWGRAERGERDGGGGGGRWVLSW